jgi:hypothetical protein
VLAGKIACLRTRLVLVQNRDVCSSVNRFIISPSFDQVTSIRLFTRQLAKPRCPNDLSDSEPNQGGSF